MNKKRKIVLFSLLTTAAAIATAVTVAGKGSAFEVPAEGCTHEGTVNHHEKVEPTLLKSGVKEYWCCCDCHKSFEDSALTKQIANTEGDPSEVTDGRYLAPIGETLKENYSKGTLITETAPTGFSKVYEKADNQQGQFLLRDDSYIQAYAKLTFAVKSATKWYTIDGWGVANYESQVWKIFELVQTGTNVWSVYSSNVGEQLLVKKSNVSGTTIKAVMNIGGDPDTYYATEVKALRKDATGVVVDQCLISSNGATTVANTTFDVPEGFESLRDYDAKIADGGGGMHGMYYSAAPLTNYSTVKFALRTTGYFLFNHGWNSNYAEPNTWFIFTLTQNQDKTWNLVAQKRDGTTYYSEDNLNGFKGEDPGVYTNYALNAILFGCPSGFYSWKQDGVDLIVSVTEVRGTLAE